LTDGKFDLKNFPDKKNGPGKFFKRAGLLSSILSLFI
jgi:hypothetical protein